jgi:excinuclease ABC subunit A
VRHNNLKNFDLDIPIGKLTVITGLSGSGKSSLAFDTLFAEGQRRYVETFSPYARQFFDRMDKPQVDRIEGIPPAIAIEQRNSVRSTRSTVGTMTELCDYLKILWPHLAQLHCRQCGQRVRKEPPQLVWERVMADGPWPIPGSSSPPSPEVLITFEVPLSAKLSLQESLDLVARQGYQRLLVDGEIVRLDEAASRLASDASRLVVVQDRLKLAVSQRARFIEACEQAYHFGKGRLAVSFLTKAGSNPEPGTRNSKLFSSGFHCATCDLDYREPSPALFSFNHPVGACAACKGFGRIISIDYHLAIPDRSRTLAGGAVKPWQSGMSAECQSDLARFCKAKRLPMNVPFAELAEEHQRWVVEGDPGYDSNDPDNSWPKKWYGVKGYFRWLESKSYKMHVRVLLSRYRAYTTCSECGGKRLKSEALLYTVPMRGKEIISDSVISNQSSIREPAGTDSLITEYSLADFYALPVDAALAFIESLAAERSFKRGDPIALALNEVRARLRYLVEVGLGYLTLDRPTRTLSGGETERVNLTTCLGTRLVNTLFVLDEPSVGLHPRDTARLVHILERLRDTGNTVVVVEHEASVMRAADRIVDLGPGRGEQGGEVVFQGPVKELLNDSRSLTGKYLSGRTQIDVPTRRVVNVGQASCPSRTTMGSESNEDAVTLHEATMPYGDRQDACPTLKITNATRHNLKNLSVEIPLGRFVALTGVSGSGKTTLARDVLLPALEARLKSQGSDVKSPAPVKASDRMEAEALPDESAAGQSAIGHRPSALLEGWRHLAQVVLVDQSPLGKTPRSNPVVYIGAFDDVRELFAQTDLAKQRGLNASAFSFNSGVGQCERCRGAGFEKIEMQFLSDVFIRCPECKGRRYRGHILEVKLRGKKVNSESVISNQSRLRRRRNAPATDSLNTDSLITEHRSIADLLEATVDDALEFLADCAQLPAGRRARRRLKLLQEVGLGYLRLGQPINTLSGGESQRLKLVSHLAEAAVVYQPETAKGITPRNTREEVERWLGQRQAFPLSSIPGFRPVTDRGEDRDPLKALQAGASPDIGLMSRANEKGSKPTLFLFDEPTTGLHFDDVRVLLQVFQRLVDAGHSVLVIEHNLDVIKCADWVIDLGPDAGERGGQLVAAGTPEDIAECAESRTGEFLRSLLGSRAKDNRPPRAHGAVQ